MFSNLGHFIAKDFVAWYFCIWDVCSLGYCVSLDILQLGHFGEVTKDCWQPQTAGDTGKS
jgi:hypothetical protein